MTIMTRLKGDWIVNRRQRLSKRKEKEFSILTLSRCYYCDGSIEKQKSMSKMHKEMALKDGLQEFK